VPPEIPLKAGISDEAKIIFKDCAGDALAVLREAGLVGGDGPFEEASARGLIFAGAEGGLGVCRGSELDGQESETLGALNQWEVGGRRGARIDAVHIERAEENVVFRQDLFGTKSRKPKQLRLCSNGSQFAGMVSDGRDHRDDIANLAVERGTNLIQHIRKGSARRDGLKNLFFESE